MTFIRRMMLGRVVAAGTVAIVVAIALPAGAQTSGRTLGIDTTNFDRSVRPQDDLFRFVNGGWVKRTDIPQDASSWGA